MTNILFTICIILINLYYTVKASKFIGKHHDFPKLNQFNQEPANEFELHIPNNIKLLTSSSDLYTISSVYPLYINNNDIVTITYESTSPSVGDWIGAYSPADVDITTTSPVRYGFCDEVDSYLSNGDGYLIFNFTNLRSDIIFYYFTGNICSTFYLKLYLNIHTHSPIYTVLFYDRRVVISYCSSELLSQYCTGMMMYVYNIHLKFMYTFYIMCIPI